MNDLTGEWFTFRQAAELLNVSPAAVRRRAKRGQWQQTLGNDKLARVRLPEDWQDSIRPADAEPRKRARIARVPARRMISSLRSHVESLKAHVDALTSHVDTLKSQLELAETRIAQQAADFAAREVRLSSDLSLERTLAEQMTSRVDRMTTDLGVEEARRTKLEHELADELSRRWWRPKMR